MEHPQSSVTLSLITEKHRRRLDLPVTQRWRYGHLRVTRVTRVGVPLPRTGS